MDTTATIVLAASGKSVLATVAFVVIGVAHVGGLMLGPPDRRRDPQP
jgi:hypothetical protein